MTSYYPLARLIAVIFFIHISINSYAFEWNDSTYLFTINSQDGETYSGDGIDWLLDRQDSTHFYLFGEQHGVSGIPKLIDFIHASLNEKQSYHLALEIDGWSAGKIMEMGVDEVFANYPFSIAFDYDEEIALIRSAEKRTPIWGMDQMLTAIHPYQRLAELASNETSRRLSQGAHLKASLNKGAYLRKSNYNDITALQEAFGEKADGEASQILDNLKLSIEIYNAWESAQRDEQSYLLTNQLREQYMLDQFNVYLQRYPDQKVLIKMGGAHIVRGIGPNGVETLGNHITNYASSKGLGALSVSLFNYNEDLPFVTKDIFRDSDIALFDCRTYLEQLSEDECQNLSEADKSRLTGYDAIILFNNSESAKRTIVIEHERSFRQYIIKNLAIGGVLILFCLSSLVPLLVFTFSKSRSAEYRQYGKNLIQLFVLSFLITVLIVYQVLGLMDPDSGMQIMNGDISLWLYVILFGLVFYIIYQVFLFIISAGLLAHKIYLGLISISLISVICFIYYWNLGGMLSF